MEWCFKFFHWCLLLLQRRLYSQIMTVVVIALCVIPLFVPKLLKKKLEKLNREALSSKAKYLEFLNEFLEGFQTIKIFGRGCEINRYHKKINEETTNKVQFNSKWRRISMSLSYGMGNFVVIGAWVFGAAFALNGSLSSQLIAFDNANEIWLQVHFRLLANTMPELCLVVL